MSRASDGFTLQFPYLPEGLDDFIDRVIPELQRRGLFRTRVRRRHPARESRPAAPGEPVLSGSRTIDQSPTRLSSRGAERRSNLGPASRHCLPEIASLPRNDSLVWCASSALNFLSLAPHPLRRYRFARTPIRESIMAKGYWIASYRSIKNPDALAAYAKLAGPAIQAGGGRFLARGIPTKTYEAGLTPAHRHHRVRQRGQGDRHP